MNQHPQLDFVEEDEVDVVDKEVVVDEVDVVDEEVVVDEVDVVDEVIVEFLNNSIQSVPFIITILFAVPL